ncbi:MAG TPA: hypothetical protein VET23_12075 [Chitinophagaceae bacterium]|nr:hypothetical protein [Chitinophagaceae bacterium]
MNCISYNFLIDPNGNIIAEDIRGQDIFNTLNHVLKLKTGYSFNKTAAL